MFFLLMPLHKYFIGSPVYSCCFLTTSVEQLRQLALALSSAFQNPNLSERPHHSQHLQSSERWHTRQKKGRKSQFCKTSSSRLNLDVPMKRLFEWHNLCFKVQITLDILSFLLTLQMFFQVSPGLTNVISKEQASVDTLPECNTKVTVILIPRRSNSAAQQLITCLCQVTVEPSSVRTAASCITFHGNKLLLHELKNRKSYSEHHSPS